MRCNHGRTISIIPGVEIQVKQMSCGHAHFQVATCAQCEATVDIKSTGSKPLPEEVVFKKMRQQGWLPHKRGRHLCPACQHADATATA